jgi:hypothetical protein
MNQFDGSPFPECNKIKPHRKTIDPSIQKPSTWPDGREIIHFLIPITNVLMNPDLQT